jgi:hypothetical protein
MHFPADLRLTMCHCPTNPFSFSIILPLSLNQFSLLLIPQCTEFLPHLCCLPKCNSQLGFDRYVYAPPTRMLFTGMWTMTMLAIRSTFSLKANGMRRRRNRLTQLNDVSNDSHDQETHAHGLGNAEELAAVGCERLHVSYSRIE